MIELPKIMAGKKEKEICPLPGFTGFREPFKGGREAVKPGPAAPGAWCRPLTDREALLDPEQGQKVAKVTLKLKGERVGVGIAATETGTLSY